MVRKSLCRPCCGRLLHQRPDCPRTTASASSSLTVAMRPPRVDPRPASRPPTSRSCRCRRRCAGRAARRRASRVGSSSRRRRRNFSSSNGRCRDDVRAEAGEARVGAHARRGHQLEHRPVELHHLVVAVADHQPGGARRARPALPALEHAPGAGHAQVRVDDEPALEAQEQVLADAPRPRRPCDPASRSRPAIAAEPRVRRLEASGT